MINLTGGSPQDQPRENTGWQYSSLMSDQTDPNHWWPRYGILLFVSFQLLSSHFWRIQFPLNVAVTSLCQWNSYLCNMIQEINVVKAPSWLKLEFIMMVPGHNSWSEHLCLLNYLVKILSDLKLAQPFMGQFAEWRWKPKSVWNISV